MSDSINSDYNKVYDYIMNFLKDSDMGLALFFPDMENAFINKEFMDKFIIISR
jgi:hypothetical protein